jgi:hypothetical protein
MRVGVPDFGAILTAIRESRATMRDGRLIGSVGALSRSEALKAPVGSRSRQLWVAFTRGFVNGTPMWSVLKRRRLRNLPDETTDSPGYRLGLIAGEFLAQVMFGLAMDFRHSDLSNLGALMRFSMHYGGSMTRPVPTGVGVGSSVLEWVRDSDTLFRAHSAAAYDAESHCFGVGERIELEFLRALAKRTGIPVPDDAEACIAERRRDAKNLPTGVEWSQRPSGGWSGADPNADFYNPFFHDPVVHLPAGDWMISAIAEFQTGSAAAPDHHSLRASVLVYVRG